VYLDPILLGRARANRGLSEKAVAVDKGLRLAVNTVLGAFRGAGLQPGNAKKLADFFELEVKDLLAPWDPLYVPPKEPPGPVVGASGMEAPGIPEPG
jgi:hypothetical protein